LDKNSDFKKNSDEVGSIHQWRYWTEVFVILGGRIGSRIGSQGITKRNKCLGEIEEETKNKSFHNLIESYGGNVVD
jgi:hypothetical protein